jgi:hypothetical protein
MTDPDDVRDRIAALLAAEGGAQPSTGYGGYPDDPDRSERRTARLERRYERDLARAVERVDPEAARAATRRLVDGLAEITGRRPVADTTTNPTPGSSPRTGATP